MRIELNQQPVFARAWFRFVGIHNNVLRLIHLARHKAPLHAGGKTSTTSAAQGRSFHFVDDLFLRHAKSFFQSYIAFGSQIRIDGGGISKAKTLGDYLYFKRTGFVIKLVHYLHSAKMESSFSGVT